MSELAPFTYQAYSTPSVQQALCRAQGQYNIDYINLLFGTLRPNLREIKTGRCSQPLPLAPGHTLLLPCSEPDYTHLCLVCRQSFIFQTNECQWDGRKSKWLQLTNTRLGL